MICTGDDFPTYRKARLTLSQPMERFGSIGEGSGFALSDVGGQRGERKWSDQSNACHVVRDSTLETVGQHLQ